MKTMKLLLATLLALSMPVLAQNTALTRLNTLTKPSGVFSFQNGTLCLKGSTSGCTPLNATAIAGTTPLVFPAGGTLALQLLTTKGDVLGYSTVPGRLAIGTDGQVLTADAASTFGFKWAAAGGGVSTFNTRTGAVTLSSGDVTGALTYTPANKALGGTETFLSSGTPGDYTLAKSGIVVKNADGDEVGRIWFTDPDIANNFNSGNIFIGPKAGLGQTTTNTNASGFGNIGIGASALPANTAGSDNVAIGQAALTFNTIGVGNTGVGRDVLFSNVEGNTNTGVGLYTLFNTTGSGNTAVGAAALSKVDAGSRNTMVGAITDIYGSGYPLVVAGNDNVFVGFDAGPTAVDTSNAIAIGKGVNVTASNHGVLGNASVTDFYFGSETAAATVHATDFIIGASGASIKPIRCVSASASGGLTIGISNKVTATCTGATTGMVATASPTTYPGDGVIWNAYVSAADTVTVVETGLGVVTPTATTFQVSVTP